MQKIISTILLILMGVGSIPTVQGAELLGSREEVEQEEQVLIFVEEGQPDILEELSSNLSPETDLFSEEISPEIITPQTVGSAEPLAGTFDKNNYLPNPEGTVSGTSKIEISEYMGIAQYNYAIQVPAGRNNWHPHVILNYQNRGRDSVVGYGWNMSRNSIRRDTSLGVDNMYEIDQYIHEPSGSKYIETSSGIYHVKYGTNTTILKKTEIGSFEMLDGSGNKYIYGATQHIYIIRD